ncbi:aspartyl-tRNA amidotransferase subunit B [Alicyclobacillus cellulosilyticus]|uniref:Aspartyl-tRNA amidotransferase subunit B n=1 Tax=Alicyclobacillus cellulosilyticus TaxID=1003997 RepID=A0A917KED2_9BACL|nr:GatB/YqeY domain-containing protein [Alicyclobacillus cellulosilyticus]GGJ09302.1 aspartyl-tRNA amidotransferase subunit B [Alicyclobacillus cellulosilyticus]
MSLLDRLNEDLKEAMKTKDKVRLSVVRMVKAAIKNKEIEEGRPLDDAGIIAVLQKEVKQRRDAMAQFAAGGRADLVAAAEAEIAVLQGYLPEPLSEEELTALVRAAIAEVGATTRQDVGKVMRVLMPKVRGRADGKLVQQRVQSELGG